MCVKNLYNYFGQKNEEKKLYNKKREDFVHISSMNKSFKIDFVHVTFSLILWLSISKNGEDVRSLSSLWLVISKKCTIQFLVSL